MKARKSYLVVLAGLVIVGLAAALPAKKASAHGDEGQFIAASSLLAGLAPGAAFPFIDTTPHGIAQAHIAITDSASDCHVAAAAPDNIKILVGQAGVALVAVMDKTTNTGISTTPGQCVYYVRMGSDPAQTSKIAVVGTNPTDEPITSGLRVIQPESGASVTGAATSHNGLRGDFT